MPSERIVTQIKSLLKKASDGDSKSSAAEVEQALAFAQKLMDKHNLEMADLVASGDEHLSDKDMGEDPVQFKAKLETFEKSLLHCVCDMTDTKWYYCKKPILDAKKNKWTRKIKVAIYGLAKDVAIARSLYAELVLVTRIMARHHMGKKWTQKHWHYMNGFADGLHDQSVMAKYKREQERRENAQSNSTALIVVKDALIEKYEEKLGLVKGRSRGRRNAPSEEFSRGHRDGSEYDLSIDESTHVKDETSKPKLN